jgi:hypothetical protein
MTDPNDLLTLVRGYSGESPEFDLDAIIRGGERRRHHRQVINGAAATTTAAGVAVAVLVASALHGSGADHHTAVAVSRPTHTASVKPRTSTTGRVKAPVPKALSVKLVAYTGKQLAGYTVARVPDGWFLGGVNAFTLTVNPPGDTNTDPAYFIDKLVVSLQPNADLPADGLHVSVNGHPGVINGLGGTQYGPTMVFEDGAGHTVDLEVPLILGWTTAAPLITFAEGIQVTGAARASVG